MSPLTEPTKLILKKDSVAATDTNIREVSLLLHGNQSGGQFVDSSLSPKTITKVGDVAPGSPGGGTPIYPSSNSAFGSAIAFDGVGDRLNVAPTDSVNFKTGDFTIETWCNFSAAGTHDILTMYVSGVPKFYFYYYYSIPNNTTVLSFYDANTLANPVYTVLFTSGQWYHIAWCRSGSTLRMFIDGVAVSTSTYTGSIDNVTSLEIGANQNRESTASYIDDFRITKGVARYTSNFTPPTAPFPDF